MDFITNELIASIIVEFFNKEKHITQSRLAEKLNVDHSSISYWLNRKGNISDKNFKLLLIYLDSKENIKEHQEFIDFLITRLCSEGFDKSKCQTILEKSGNISTILYGLISTYSNVIPQLQKRLNVPSIISRIRSMCQIYGDYIGISEQQLGAGDESPVYTQWISCSQDKQDPSLLTQQNYLILNFPNRYRIAIVLTDYIFQDIFIFGDSVKQLKEKNNIHLVIIFTDNEIPFSYQKYFMETHNLFFETITSNDLLKTKVQNISLRDATATPEIIEVLFYAQEVFERLTSYFAVIRNEIIFRTFEQNRNNRIINTLKDNTDLFKGFVDKVLLKEIFKYSYLSRHSIYFERARLRETVLEAITQRETGKLGNVMEICFPNSFLSSSIYEYCDKLLLFTSSYHSLNVMKKINDENDNTIFPQNVSFNLAHINPQYITNQYGDEISGKVDLVILGFGMGSSLINLTEYLRYINSWLSPNGILFISFANADSVILHKQFNVQDYFETTPVYFSDYWQYTATETLKFLARIKRYTVDEVNKLVTTYVDQSEYYTYPFLSGLLNIPQNDKWMKDTVRSIDKENALQKKGKHGHYITIVGKKVPDSHLLNVSSERRSIQIYGLVQHYLDKLNIEYEIIEHSVTIDTNSLFKALLEKGEDFNQFDLIRTVILKETGSKSDELSIKYVIAPRDSKICLNNNKINLLPEKQISQLFGIGSVSPLVILPNVIDYTQFKGQFYIYGIGNLIKEYVIISSGISSSSLKMKREDFLQIVNELGVISLESAQIVP